MGNIIIMILIFIDTLLILKLTIDIERIWYFLKHNPKEIGKDFRKYINA